MGVPEVPVGCFHQGGREVGDGAAIGDHHTTSDPSVVVERGIEWERRKTNDLDKLLYWIFANLTFSMAVEYELAHRVEGQDFRPRHTGTSASG